MAAFWRSFTRESLATGPSVRLVTANPRVNSGMIIIGLICLVLGIVLSSAILWTIGIVLIIIGAILWLLGSMDRGVGGRRHYF
ncbi:MAG TPA: DUF6131 family protein [Baekduia sp.]|nr:DUF6131 family protein [Baekduia sp.]